jgi:hypothetical protein
MNYSENLEEDGIFGEKPRLAWAKAYREWNDYGDREIPTTFGDIIRLNDRGMYHDKAEQLAAQIDAMAGGLREKIAEERKADLTTEEREAYETPREERTERQHELAFEVDRKLNVSHQDVAKRLSGAERGQAMEIAEQLEEAERLADVVRRYQQIVNYEFWQRRADVEQTPEALQARQLCYEARRELTEQISLRPAKEKIEAGLAKWREVLDLPQFPHLLEDRNLGRDIIDAIKLYRRILDASDEPFPEDFILQDVVEQHRDMLEEP